MLEAGGPELSRQLQRTETRLAEVADGHGAELGRHAAGTLAAGGKRLRPVLVFLCGGEGDGLLAAAAAVELLHMATLVHDDVLDQAPLRRGAADRVRRRGPRRRHRHRRPPLLARLRRAGVHGQRAAVEALSQASSALARGELMQRADAWSESVSPGALPGALRAQDRPASSRRPAGSAPCSATARAPEAALAGFGRRIGLAFQILDDVLDVSGPSERTGKQRGTDLLDGTVTLPLIVARGARSRAAPRWTCASVVTEPAQAEAVCDRIALTGALGEARAAGARATWPRQRRR